jgi:hypothetical protein
VVQNKLDLFVFACNGHPSREQEGNFHTSGDKETAASGNISKESARRSAYRDALMLIQSEDAESELEHSELQPQVLDLHWL